MNAQRGKLVSGGRLRVLVGIPLGLADGDPVLLRIVDGKLHVRPVHNALSRVQARLRAYVPEGSKKPKLSDRQQKELRRMYDTGDYSISDLAEPFSISRPTVYRTHGRQPTVTAVTAKPAWLCTLYSTYGSNGIGDRTTH